MTRRLRTELGTRLDSYNEAEAMIESNREGYPPFFREKCQTLAITDNEPAQVKFQNVQNLSCNYLVGKKNHLMVNFLFVSVTMFRCRRSNTKCSMV